MSSFSRCAKADQYRNMIEWSICTVSFSTLTPGFNSFINYRLCTICCLFIMVTCLTETMLRLPCISLPTFPVTSHLMPSFSLAANPLARERSGGTLPKPINRPLHFVHVLQVMQMPCFSELHILMTGNVMLSSE